MIRYEMKWNPICLDQPCMKCFQEGKLKALTSSADSISRIQPKIHEIFMDLQKRWHMRDDSVKEKEKTKTYWHFGNKNISLWDLNDKKEKLNPKIKLKKNPKSHRIWFDPKRQNQDLPKRNGNEKKEEEERRKEEEKTFKICYN